MTVAESAVAPTRLGVRWRRALAINVIGLGMLTWLATQLWTGTVFGLGAGLVVQGQKSQFNTAKLSTTNVGFGIMPIKVSDGAGGSTDKYVLRMGFAGGTLDGFCISQTQSLLGVPFTIRITSRDNALNVADVTGKNVQFDVTEVSSTNTPNTSGDGIQLRGNVGLGVATQSITTWQSGGTDVVNPLDAPESFTGINGRLFGVDSDVGDLYNLKGDIYDAVIEGPLSIKGLKIEVVQGEASSVGCKSIGIVY
ncbi:DUF6230 family protein [Nocardioides sp.]|uniref:DUF6230 family protein n=1 Tax=Nocardioides sp. TaxID=35761 RepID=UPI0039E6B4D0